jgi:carbon storage regulator
MLILTRRVGETVIVGNDVTVTIVAVAGDQIHIGIKAPKHVPIRRKEIYEPSQREHPIRLT